MDLLKNKTALVTGAGSGIGKSIALAYAAAGANLVLSDINEAHGQEVAQQVSGQGAQVIFVKADSASPEDNEKLVKAATEKFGALHIACNNAGIGGPALPTGGYTLDGWQKVININLNGVFYGMRYQLPAMLKAGGGVIVNMASILGSVGFRTAAAYVAAKHGVVGLTQTAALEYAPQNIRINAVGPGFIDTPLLSQMNAAQKQALVALHPIGRLGKPEEVAELVLWLSSDKASFVTGSYYPVDGGYLGQ
ncbi:short-chain dehydrogenase [Chitinophaga parva]|uniref:Short-chain dehydrogenase n=1 Tax=Chitinophaga parva TaxID=2169414 RepID=A0A2T7BKI4_9BACT|nr:SDR family NAD(P)-dependent oxidoreductase [Chitinophaga parva]PUZ28186.1 short-chain dehydrogenase [Chitinophaga parva]